MELKEAKAALFALLAPALLALPAGATPLVQQMNLNELLENSGYVGSMTITDVTKGTVQAGGTQLPIVTYSARVIERFKGISGDQRVIEFSMLGGFEGPATAVDGVLKLTSLPEVPRLEIGKQYLMILTAIGPAGLCAPVGLQQGVFEITGRPGDEVVTNLIGNAGLFRDMPTSFAGGGSSQLTYAEMVSRITTYFGQ